MYSIVRFYVVLSMGTILEKTNIINIQRPYSKSYDKPLFIA